MLSAYLISKHDGKSMLNFGIDLYPEEVEDVTSSLRKYGVKAFTISAPLTAPRTTAVLDAFRNFGVVAKNIADINNCNGARIPILLMKVA